MTITTNDARTILTDEQVEELFVEPVLARAVAALDGVTSTVIRLDGPSWRAPKMTKAPRGAWVSEGSEIPASDAEFSEVESTPKAIKSLVPISSETFDDTAGEAAEVIGAELTNDAVEQLDAAFVADLPDPAPGGLESVDYSTFLAGDLTDLDAFGDVVAAAADEFGADITGFVCSWKTARRLGRLKAAEGSNVPLLSVDPALPSRRIVEGRPLVPARGVPDDVCWALPASRIRTLVRLNNEITADRSVYYTSDRIAVRGKLRASFGFLQPEAVFKMTFNPVTSGN